MAQTTSIKIGELSDKKSLKSKLSKKAKSLKPKAKSLHAHIVETLLKHGV